MKIKIIAEDDEGSIYEGNCVLVEISGNKKQKKNIVVSKTKIKPSIAIDGLFHEGFFTVKKKLNEIENKLGNSGFNFNKSSVFRAADRAKYLQKKGKSGNFSFIQKYPPQ